MNILLLQREQHQKVTLYTLESVGGIRIVEAL